MIAPGSGRLTYQYDDADRRTGILRRNLNARTTIVYDAASQVTEVLHRNILGNIITAFTYTYDDAGTRTSLVEPGPVTVTWGYDNAYRLTSEVRQNSAAVLYRDTHTYDDV